MKSFHSITRLFLSKLVILSIFLVMALSIGLIIMVPENALRWSMALFFFPLTVGAITHSFKKKHIDGINIPNIGKIRAAIVGAGFMLATSLAITFAESLGYQWEEIDGGLGFLNLLPALIAVALDLAVSRLQAKEEKSE